MNNALLHECISQLIVENQESFTVHSKLGKQRVTGTLEDAMRVARQIAHETGKSTKVLGDLGGKWIAVAGSETPVARMPSHVALKDERNRQSLSRSIRSWLAQDDIAAQKKAGL